MDLTNIKTESPEKMGADLREAERKNRTAGVNAAQGAIVHLQDGEYEEALLATQNLYAAIVKASDAAQIVARYFAAPDTSSPANEGSNGE